MRWSPLAEKVHQYIIRHSLAGTGDTIALALSGGLDSVALLHVVMELQSKWHWKLAILHVDHGLRPESDPKESAFCRELAATYHLPYFEKKLELLKPKKKTQYRSLVKNNPGPESLARIARYQAFDVWAEELRCDALFTAHHANDQAETVLYRMLTGSGIGGLKGIPVKRGIYRRPLRSILRSELEAYVHAKGLSYCEDPSNKNETFIRNRIRHTLLPGLKTMGFEQAEQALARSAASLEEAEDALHYYTGQLVREFISSGETGIMLKLKGLKNLPVYFQKTLLKYIYSEILHFPRHISEKQLEQMLDFTLRSETGHRMEILGSAMVKEREHIIWPLSAEPDHSIEISCGEGEYPIDAKGGMLKVSIENTPVSLQVENPATAIFSMHLLGKTMLLRPWTAGDRLRLFGSGETKKVSDVLKDEKIAPAKKKEQKVILSDNKIIWIPGIKHAEEYVVNRNENRIVKIQYINGEKR
ncbi:MAG: tRNA lysidine(34) synthetase TilS [FCB group bacterium]|nr:tRNA lysidine(34) synthetase TilS [FCB group bacterium]